MNPSPVPVSTSSLTLLLLLLLCICFSDYQSHAQVQLIPKDEVKTLQVIASKLNIIYWNVTETACMHPERSFNKNISSDDIVSYVSNVTCNCSYKDSTTCHVTNILLKGLSLTGVLPDEFSNLTKLIEIDLTRNYMSGPIPSSLAKIPLVNLSLGANRFNGSIPTEIGQISTLEELVLDDNLLGGQLPHSLGNLKKLKRLLLSANNFTGTIPETFGNLKKLNDFRIDGSNLSGKIPSFIGNWTDIKKLHMQGTNMEGPIPSTLGLLTKITEVRISDLRGSSMTFPNLTALPDLKNLVLRNCLITGPIPKYIGGMENLKMLDLSFNRLTGPIPTSFLKLDKLSYMFLTNNSLSGSVPNWVINSKDNIDVSYNSFTGSVTTSRQAQNVNLASSLLSAKGTSDPWWWKKDLPCPNKAKYYSFFINCGGTTPEFDGNDMYEKDGSTNGPSYFSSADKWAVSSTGVFMMAEEKGNYITSAISGLHVTGPAYLQTARTSPISLKYYGTCMQKGNYTVKLHFAEIMFSNDHSFSSIGRRIFDVAIQGEVKLQDFNIMDEAGVAGNGTTKQFDNIVVDGSTLEIHLYWRGKGTNNIPSRGIYGPLINAISVTPNFKVDDGGLPIGAIVGIAVAAFLVVLVLVLVVLKLTGVIGRKESNEFQNLATGYFSLRQIKAATDDFNPANKIGEGGFGPVYKGVLPDGKVIAVKQLSSQSKQGNREFVNEIGMISALQHPNLVKLHGCCIEGKELLLIYEYLENNSLSRALFGRGEERLNLDWPTRKRICLGIARGLAYLHEESRLKIVHRDIKGTNVLLDKDLNAKISDFGLAKLDEEDNTHISTRIAGTIGYMAPEYAMRGYLTYKADVYSFGVVALELFSGKSNTNYRPKDDFVYLLDWAYVLQEQGNLLELMDPTLTDYSKEEALRLLTLALLCTNPSPSLRPVMSSVVSMIEGKTPVQAQVVRLTEIELSALRNMSRTTCSQVSSDLQYSGQTHSSNVMVDGPWINSSVTNGRNDDTDGSSPSNTLLEHVTL